MSVRTLRYGDIAPGLPFHAALITSEASGFTVQAHDHDFSEFMLILDGSGVHDLNDEDLPLEPGQVWRLAPEDAHSIYARPGHRLTYINVAFPLVSWERFLGLAAIPPPPTLTSVDAASLSEITLAFQNVLSAFAARPTDLDLLAFFVTIGRGSRPLALEEGPVWLQGALKKMRLEQNLFAGLPRFLRLCSVSPAHLSRVVRTLYGVTPTELVNRCRLDHAKMLLATTVEDAETIAFRCGFNHVPYFYRLFRRSEGVTPREYRRSLRQKIAP